MKDNLIVFTGIRNLSFQLLCPVDICLVSSLFLVGVCSLPGCVSDEEQISRLKILLGLIAVKWKAAGWTCSTPGTRKDANENAQESVSMEGGVGRAKLILQSV